MPRSRNRANERRRQAIRALVAARAELFARQGVVATTWRMHKGQRLGPYFQLRYREGGRQRAVHLGADPHFACEVRTRLQALQAPRRQRRADDKERAQLYAIVRQQKRLLEAELHQVGLQMQGYEVRGFRRRQQG
jgi:hypothetical protein